MNTNFIMVRKGILVVFLVLSVNYSLFSCISIFRPRFPFSAAGHGYCGAVVGLVVCNGWSRGFGLYCFSWSLGFSMWASSVSLLSMVIRWGVGGGSFVFGGDIGVCPGFFTYGGNFFSA